MLAENWETFHVPNNNEVKPAVGLQLEGGQQPECGSGNQFMRFWEPAHVCRHAHAEHGFTCSPAFTFLFIFKGISFSHYKNDMFILEIWKIKTCKDGKKISPFILPSQDTSLCVLMLYLSLCFFLRVCMST